MATAARAEPERLQIEGTLGTIPAHLVQAAFESRMERFNRCYAEGLGRLPYLSGEVLFAARVARDGSPRWVHLRAADVGDRAVERCLTDVASRIRFPAPSEGEAEVTYSFSLPPADDARPPERWSADRAGRIAAEHQAEIASCKTSGPDGSYALTLYVDAQGQVIAAGGTGPTAGPPVEGVVDCLSSAALGWRIRPASHYMSKVTLAIR